MTSIHYRLIPTPCGPLLLAGDSLGLREVVLPGGKRPQRAEDDWREDHGELDEAAQQLEEYFAGQRRTFDLVFSPQGTDFQRQVWAELVKIPYGQTISYAELARRVGRAGAARAVGAANGRNPLPIVVPCHRVIGADGSLVGYGGGMHNKKLLLQLERDFLQQPLLEGVS